MATKKLTRIVTIYDQWSYILLWINNDKLYNEWTQWIVINDLPSDSCPERIAKQFEIRSIKLIQNKWNLGVSAARNFCVSHCSTEWIEFIDGDDLPLPIDRCIFADFEDKGLISFPIRYHKLSPDNRVQPFEVENDSKAFSWLLDLYPPIDVKAVATMWRRESFLAALGFDSRMEGAEDLHLVWKADRLGIQLAKANSPKQSYYEANPNKVGRLYYGIGFIRALKVFEKELRARGEETRADMASEAISIYSYGFYWSARGVFLEATPRPSITFRLKESLKMLLNVKVDS